MGTRQRGDERAHRRGLLQYGPTVTYGRETTATIFAGDITTQTSEQMYGKPGQVLHYRVIARTGDGLVFEGGDSTVVLGSATPATPELSTRTPVVTPTTIDLPYTGAVTGTVDGFAVAYRREAGQPELQVAELQPVASDGEDHAVLDQAQARRAAQRRRAQADEDAPLQVAGTSSS